MRVLGPTWRPSGSQDAIRCAGGAASGVANVRPPHVEDGNPSPDDLWNAPALEIATELTRLGARVRAYDPAVRRLPSEHAQHVELTTDPIELARNADALVLATEWPEFARFDLDARPMRTPIVLDGRNFLDPEAARRAGFVYLGVGHQTEAPPHARRSCTSSSR